jgi:hypothetical protein
MEINENNRYFWFHNSALSSLALTVVAAYSSVRDDLTNRLGATPKQATVPYHNAYGATWENISSVWDTETVHVELSQDNNPAKPSLPDVSVRSQEVYKEVLEREKREPKPLDK